MTRPGIRREALQKLTRARAKAGSLASLHPFAVQVAADAESALTLIRQNWRHSIMAPLESQNSRRQSSRRSISFDVGRAGGRQLLHAQRNLSPNSETPASPHPIDGRSVPLYIRAH